jgi:hypothetical protein
MQFGKRVTRTSCLVLAFSKEGPEITLLSVPLSSVNFICHMLSRTHWLCEITHGAQIELVKAENATVFQIVIMLVCRPRCVESLRMEEIGNAGGMLHVLLFLLVLGLLNELNWKFGWIVMDILLCGGFRCGLMITGFWR